MGKDQTESYPVKRGKFDSLTLYDVTEQELTIIEGGSTNSLFLNISIALLSVAISFFSAIFTVDWFPQDAEPSLIKFTVFLVVAVVTLIGGLICGMVYLKSHDSFKATLKTIRLRLKENEADEIITDDSIQLAE